MSKLKEIVVAIGRPKICEKLGITNQYITNQISLGYFPASWHLGLTELANEADIEIPQNLFNWKLPADSDRHTAA